MPQQLPAHPDKITLDDKIKVIKRELYKRRSYYPTVCFGPSAKMKPDEAAFQIKAMEEILKDYEALKAKEGVQTSLF